jgi:hypothetical protein
MYSSADKFACTAVSRESMRDRSKKQEKYLSVEGFVIYRKKGIKLFLSIKS